METTPETQSKTHRLPAGREDWWSEDATATLIEAWGDRYVNLNRGNLRQNDWKEVADAVNSSHGNGRPKTDVQCKNRIDTLKKKYKTEKAKPFIACPPLSSSSSLGSGSLLINDCSEYDVEGFEKEQHGFDVEERKPEIVMMHPLASFGVAKMQHFPIKEEVATTVNLEFTRKRKQNNDMNVMVMDRSAGYTCENGQCPHSKMNLGFQDRSSRDNHQMVCPYRDNRLAYGASKFHMGGMKLVVPQQPVQPIDLSGVGVPENGQKMITELMAMYDRNVQSNQTPPTLMENQSMVIDAKAAQNQQLNFNSGNQMFMQQGTNNGVNNRFQMVFDSTPFDMAAFDYRDDWQTGAMEGMGKQQQQQQQQQDVSIWF